MRMKETQKKKINNLIMEILGYSSFGGYPLKNRNATLETIPNAALGITLTVIQRNSEFFFTLENVFERYCCGIDPTGLSTDETSVQFCFPKSANFSNNLDYQKWKKYYSKSDSTIYTYITTSPFCYICFNKNFYRRNQKKKILKMGMVCVHKKKYRTTIQTIFYQFVF